MKKKKMVSKLTLQEMHGRIPVPTKSGGYMTPKKGKGSFKRNKKHKKGWSFTDDHPFFCWRMLIGISINTT